MTEPMTKPDLMAELAEVVRRRRMATSLESVLRANQDAADYLTEHHAELEAVVRDDRRLDWLETMANKPGGLLLHDGSESGRCGLGLRPGAANRDLRTAIDQAMRNSAREG